MKPSLPLKDLVSLLEGLLPLAQQQADDAVVDEDEVRQAAEDLLHRTQSAITMVYMDIEAKDRAARIKKRTR